MHAEDILPDTHDHVERHGVRIRKGTVGAFLANSRLWLDPACPVGQRRAAESALLRDAPALRALGLFDVLTPRNPGLRRLLDLG
ncbi:hypothetical protein BTL55_14315 [Bordetella trematum]|uniref:hypothetical protein n=1 Tax=Bordetella trematum TaxID=123899 RepID=UPI000C787158|nr:hypothetical protein [Bordetella trematum]AUL48014.1 hypothetical protein BTL55_14315 [Bordetella trematum]